MQVFPYGVFPPWRLLLWVGYLGQLYPAYLPVLGSLLESLVDVRGHTRQWHLCRPAAGSMLRQGHVSLRLEDYFEGMFDCVLSYYHLDDLVENL